MYDAEIAECQRRIAMGNALNTLLNTNPDFQLLIARGFLRDEVLRQSLNINSDKSGTVTFLEAVQTFKAYLDRVSSEAEQAHMDLRNYQQLPQDGA